MQMKLQVKLHYTWKFEAWGFIEVPFIQEDPLDATIEVVRKEELLDKEESLANNINFIKKYWWNYAASSRPPFPTL